MNDKHPATEVAEIRHFTECALRGRSGAASPGERICRRLAANLADIGDDLALLDSTALNGYLLLCQLASGPWKTDAEKYSAFDLINRAAS